MPQALHIVHVAKQVNLAVCAIARQLAQRGHRQTLLSLLPSHQHGDEARAAGMEVVDEPSRARILAELEHADIVRLEWWNCPHLGALIREPLPAMRLMTVIHVAGDGYPNPVTRGLVEFSDLVVAGCPYTRDHGLLGALPAELRERKLACVRATPDFARIEGVTRLHGEDDRFTVGYIGTLDRRKIHPAIIDMSAAARVPDIRFVLRGKGDPTHLHERIAALGLGARFDVGGYVHDIAAVLARCDVFGYPIAVDPGAEMAVQEAMYAGVVPVVFPRGGLRDLVIDGFTGLVVETAEAYARALEYLHQHPDERARMSDNARSFARQLLGPVRAADQLERLYASMMETPKRTRTWTWDVAPQARPATAAERFLDALGGAPTPFATSMRSTDLEAVLAAEAEIAAMQTGAYVLHSHARAATDDGYLQLWSGLVREQAGDLEGAAAAFKLASRAGLRHFRVGFYLARIDEQLGRNEEARRLIQNVLDHALNFEPARALLSRVASRVATRPRQTPLAAVFSYPRSGNTWLRYVIEVLTGRPSVVPRNIVNDRPIAERFPELGIDPTADPSAMKCHRLDDLPEGEHWLIVAVRDYSECIVRHRHDEPETEFGFDEELPRYLEPLRYFHEFAGPKLLLYYEDLIRDRQGTITAVGEFLGLGPEPVRRFMADYEAHFRRSVVGYSPGSHTGGRAARHHGARVSPEMWTRWRAAIVAEAPEIHAAYLARYD